MDGYDTKLYTIQLCQGISNIYFNCIGIIPEVDNYTTKCICAQLIYETMTYETFAFDLTISRESDKLSCVGLLEERINIVLCIQNFSGISAVLSYQSFGNCLQLDSNLYSKQ